jgi:Beta-xylosidase
MVNWQWVSSVFTGHESFAGWNNGEGGVWAPSVVKIGETFNFYYCLGQGGFYSNFTGIGVATSSTPYGPWTHYGKIFDSGEIGVKNSIDPFIFEENGKVYMSFGSGDGIWIVELNAEGTALKNGLADAVANKVMIGGYQMYEGTNYEASFIQKKNGFYYLYLSTGSCCDGLRSTYHVVVGRSESMYGPYVGEDGRAIDRSDRGKTVIESHMTKGTGTGHCAIIQDAKGLNWLVYHAYDPNEEGSRKNERVLYIDRLYWGSDGFPTCKDQVPTHETVPGPYVTHKGVSA